MPPAVFSSASRGSTTTRSSRGRTLRLVSFSLATVSSLFQNEQLLIRSLQMQQTRPCMSGGDSLHVHASHASHTTHPHATHASHATHTAAHTTHAMLVVVEILLVF